MEWTPRSKSSGRRSARRLVRSIALLQEIVRRVWQDGLTMEQLGAHYRPRLPVAWEPRYDPLVGLRLYLHALVALDLHDANFRPKTSV